MCVTEKLPATYVPAKNNGWHGATERPIHIHEGEKIDAAAFKALVKAAVAENARA